MFRRIRWYVKRVGPRELAVYSRVKRYTLLRYKPSRREKALRAWLNNSTLARNSIALLLISVSLFAIMRPASAAVIDIIPDSIVSQTGFANGDITSVDEGRTANTLDTITTGTTGATGDNITFSFGTVPSVGSATQLILGVNTGGTLASTADDMRLEIKVNGVAVNSLDFTHTTAYTWRTVTATGTWTQADIDSITATVTRVTAAGSGSAGNRDDTVNIASLYTEVTYTQSITFTQSAYRWYDNADSLTPGSPLAVENTTTSISATNPLRLRVGVDVGASSLAAGSKKFKLQYAASTSGPWTDVANRSFGPPFTKLSNPSSLPSLNGYFTAWSPDGTYMSVGSNGTPTLIIYKRSGDTFTKLADPATLPPSTARSAAWSPDGTYMSVAHEMSPYITIYKRSGDTFTKLADPAALPAGTGNGVAWSSDGVYMTVAHSTTPFITIYKRSGDTFTKLADPAALPTIYGISTAWSADTTYMSVSHNTTPYITIYKRSGDTFTKLANPASLPSGSGSGVAWSPDGTYMSVAHNTTPFITIYKRSGDTFTKLANPATLPTGTGNGVAWSADGAYMSVAHASSPYVTIYERSGDTFTKLANPATLPTGTGNGVAWSADGAYMSVGHGTSPYITIYKTTDIVPAAAIWGYKNNPAPTDGSTISAALLSGSPVLQSYTESNPTVNNPTAINSGQRGEWDFALDSSNVREGTTYYFRMAQEDGTALNTYSTYPQVTTGSATDTQSAYRWYNNANSVQPGTALANENTEPADVSPGTVVRLRAAITRGTFTLPAGSQSYRLQHATSTGGPWTDVSDIVPLPDTKLADPTSLPTGNGNGVAWSPDGTYMSVAHSTTPFITIYKRSGDTFTKLADPAALPTGSGDGVAWSPDGTYLSVAYSTSPYITIYKRSGDTFTKLADPAALPTGIGSGVAWSPDGTYMSVAHSTTPFITIYKRSGDTFTKLADPAALPTNNANAVAWSPDGTYMSVGYASSPYIIIYTQSGDTFTKLSDPASSPTGIINAVAWSPDGTYLSVAHWTTPWLTVYKRSGNTFTKLADPAALPTGTASGVAWSPDGKYLNIVHNNSPYTTRYKIFNDTFLKMPNPATLPANHGRATQWSPDGTYMSVAHASSPYITIYKTSPASAWKYHNNSVPVDGTAISTTLLSNNPIAQTYNESLLTTVYPQAINIGQRGEWDFALDSTNAAAGTAYYFRMVKSDGTALSTYSVYPQINTPPPPLDQASYRWYGNADSAQPGSSLANENVAASIGSQTPFRLRQRIGVSSDALPINSRNFNLQYRQQTGGVCTLSGSGFSNIGDSNITASAGTATDQFTGSEIWNDVFEAEGAPDGAYAHTPLSTAAANSDTLALTNYGFSIPTDATITGVEVTIYGNYTSDAEILQLGLTQNGTSNTTTIAATTLPTTGNPVTYGSATNLVGQGWTPAAINSSSFGARLSAIYTGISFGDVFIDSVGIRVHYTPANSGTSPIEYYDNASVSDGTTISSTVDDPTNSGRAAVMQSYQEANTFTNNVAAVPAGSDGLWDFSLTTTPSASGNTYCFRVARTDGSILTTVAQIPQITISSSNTSPSNPTTLQQKKTDDTVLASGSWVNSTSVKFSALVTDPDAADMLQICVEADLIGNAFSNTEDQCGTAVAYTGTQVAVSITLTVPTDPGEYHWQARVKDAGGLYSSWVSYDVNLESARDFGVDTTAPVISFVNDGPGADLTFNDGSLTTLVANWGINYDLSGPNILEYSIGVTPGGTTVLGWSALSAELDSGMSDSSLSLKTSEKYFVNVRATDIAGNTSVVSSNGQLVAPSVSFSVSPSVVTFDNLNPSNSYTNTKTTTLTTSTNAYGGYVVRSFITDLLRSSDNRTMGNFSGGSYASPDSWQPGDTGLGYTSSDTLVQGVNKFQSATCLGGSELAVPGCFAPFASSGPGDVIADHTTNVSGTPVTNQQFTMTYRATTTNTQAATKYTTNIVYTITPIY